MVFCEIVLCEKYTPARSLVSVLPSGRGGESAVIAIDFIKGADVGHSLKAFQNQIGYGRGIFHGKMVLSSGKRILCDAI